MTLKEKLEVIKNYDDQDPHETFMKIADDYAIEFAQWVQFHSELWIKYRTSELLELFKKENQL